MFDRLHTYVNLQGCMVDICIFTATLDIFIAIYEYIDISILLSFEVCIDVVTHGKVKTNII